MDITTVCSDMMDLSPIAANTVDLVISMSAETYAEDFNKVCEEVGRVLRSNGRFVFSTTHPFMACIGATELWADENTNPNYSYKGAFQWKWNAEDAFVFTTYRRQISDYVNALAKNNFMLKRMEELFPVTPLPDDNDFDENEMKVRTRYPSVLVVEAVKI